MRDAAGEVLLLGSGGQVGTELRQLLGSTRSLVCPRSSELDMTNERDLREMIRTVKPRWILNAAAYTAVDRAESEPELAAAVNDKAVRILGEEAELLSAVVVHFSTDYVFDGAASTPRRESDATGPINVYGQSKLAGEHSLVQSGATHFTFRTSWVYSSHGKNFLTTILNLARTRPTLKIVSDQIGAPTYAENLARLVEHTIGATESKAFSQQLSLCEAASSLSGTYHASDAGFTNWFAFADRFVSLAREVEPGETWAQLQPIPTAEYPTAARRPADSRLDCTLLGERLGFYMPHWEESLKVAMTQVFEGKFSSSM